jgi:hypothetical protein
MGCLNIFIGLVLLSLLGWLTVRYALRPFYINWGASSAEIRANYPGDELLLHPEKVTTRAITIRASPRQIWPWLVQIGADKGGWYSYTWIEGLLGCPITNADQINPEWQELRIGDSVKLCPDETRPPAYTVAAIHPDQALVIGHFQDGDQEAGLDPYWLDTWAFVLEPINAAYTRLIIRARFAGHDSIMDFLEPGIFLMERGMLLGIKARTETFTN